ncbi:hypothetical protein LG358_00096 [Escherichia phage UoN_LG358_1]|nr:hypothetical protein LG358_00096 [Escherichia phage UoN_LG358_1]
MATKLIAFNRSFGGVMTVSVIKEDGFYYNNFKETVDANRVGTEIKAVRGKSKVFINNCLYPCKIITIDGVEYGLFKDGNAVIVKFYN